MNNIWGAYPMFRLLLPFMSGIVMAVNSSWRFDEALLLALLLFVIFLVSGEFLYRQLGYQWISGTVLFAALILAGFGYIRFFSSEDDEEHLHNYTDRSYTFQASLYEAPVEKPNTYRSFIRVNKVLKDGAWQQCKGNLLVYFTKGEGSNGLRLGDVMLIHIQPEVVKPPSNPLEFNYKRYLSFRQVEHRATVKDYQWIKLEQVKETSLKYYAHQLRDYLLSQLREKGITGKNFGVGAALITGYENELTPDIVSAYAATGALHVLAVSGLHVGIIFMVLNVLLRFMEKSKRGKIVRYFIIITFLWFYAFLTGLSPSVMRAATMFTFILSGTVLDRNASTYNILAGSALFLLVVNPFLITEVGFQLSFCAVLGIVSFHRIFYNIWQPNNFLLNQAWNISCVSLAAQLATFPLGILYFHQFPNYFLLSNLIVIPMSSIILYSGVAFILFHQVPYLSDALAWLLDMALLFINAIVHYFEDLPGAVMQGLSISTVETFSIYAIILMTYFFLRYKYAFLIKYMLLLLTINLGWQLKEATDRARQREMVFFAVNKHTAINFIHQRQHVFLSDSSLMKDYDKLHFHVFPYWYQKGLDLNVKHAVNANEIRHSETGLLKREGLVQFQNKLVYLLNRESAKQVRGKVFPEVDYVLLQRGLAAPGLNLKEQFPRALFIAESNLTYRDRELVSVQLKREEVHQLNEQGALVVRLE
jgi:competence protein ComEC